MQTAMRGSTALTFRPVSGGRLKCNQRPGLPAMSARQAEQLRRSGKKPVQPIDMPAPVDHTHLVYIGEGILNEFPCHHCNKTIAARTGEQTCPHCHEPFRVIGTPKHVIPVVYMSMYGTFRCPTPVCSYPNRLSSPDTQKFACTLCGQELLAEWPPRKPVFPDYDNIFGCPHCRSRQRARKEGDAECVDCHGAIEIIGYRPGDRTKMVF